MSKEATAVKTSDPFVVKTLEQVRQFYQDHPEIQHSHGLSHAMDVFHHAARAVECLSQISKEKSRDILIAAVLHDVDDRKYFPDQVHGECQNAKAIMERIQLPHEEQTMVIRMIGWVSGSYNGNTVPEMVQRTGQYQYLIPRWADRIEAMGKAGVVRCYDFSVESGQPLWTSDSPRALTEDQVWQLAHPGRFQHYQETHRQSQDMISHYYDKLLHTAYPPKESIRNSYLEGQMHAGATYLVEVAIRFGKTGRVDETYIDSLRT